MPCGDGDGRYLILNIESNRYVGSNACPLMGDEISESPDTVVWKIEVVEDHEKLYRYVG